MSASRTAQYVALYRALEATETRRPRLFEDVYAKAFLPAGLRAVVWLAGVRPLRAAIEAYADRRGPGARTSAIGRTRLIDDVVRAAMERGTRQVVILGAGYDCRAHRLPELRAARVFEVDRAEIQALKRARIASLPGTRPDVDYVTVDFGVDDVGERLAAAGWVRERPTAFIWEGVTNYLREPDVERILGLVGGAAAGSVLVFTFVHRGVIDGTAVFEGAHLLVDYVRSLGEPWTFGLVPEEVEGFLRRFGLALDDHLGADEYRARYLGSEARDLHGYAFYRIAVARVP